MPDSSALVGAWLADLAAQCGLSQAEIADQLGHVRSWVNHIFQGRRVAPQKLVWTLLAWAWESGVFTDPARYLPPSGSIWVYPWRRHGSDSGYPLPREARGSTTPPAHPTAVPHHICGCAFWHGYKPGRASVWIRANRGCICRIGMCHASKS
jgi:hypothetical protein